MSKMGKEISCERIISKKKVFNFDKPRDKRRGTCKDNCTGNSERRKKERNSKEEMGRQHRRMDWTEAEQGNRTCRRQREMKRTGS